MSTCVMLSIRPEFADRIFGGTKQYEFRRRLFRNRSVHRVVVYVTAPISKVVGEFEIDAVLELELEALWARTRHHSGIPKPLFDAYFSGKQRGYAIKIGRTYLYDCPRDLQTDFDIKCPPQSFVYLESSLSSAKK